MLHQQVFLADFWEVDSRKENSTQIGMGEYLRKLQTNRNIRSDSSFGGGGE